MRRSRHTVLAVVATAAVVVVAGCGGDAETGGIKAPQGTSQSAFARQLKTAQTVSAGDFPAVGGRSLQQIADTTAASGTQVGLATSVFVAGENRLAWGGRGGQETTV
jgi:hypothetical protein